MSFRFLKITILPDDVEGLASAEDLNDVIDGIRTTLPDGRDFLDGDGNLFILIESDQELMDESICLGTCYAQLREDGYEEPFGIELVVQDEMPSHSFAGPTN
jgi:hypothetical protein